MPVTHRYDGAGGNVRLESGFERAGLLFREAANGGTAADFHVVLADYFGARGGNEFGDGFAREEGAGKIDDVWIAEEVVEKRLDRGLTVRATELKQDHCDFFGPAHVAPLANSASVAAIAVSGVRFLRALE